MGLKSEYLKEFINEITYRNRTPQNIEALEMLNELETNPVMLIAEGEELYRARVITQSNQSSIGKDSVNGFWGFDASGSYVTPVEYTKDMRANYRYIPYLYCANNAYLAVVEVRPRLGASVSVATITVKSEIKLLDFTGNGIYKKPPTDAKKNLLSDLSTLYSIPVTDEDDVIDYIPTQFIAEYAKNLGYDGISFSSSLTPDLSQNYSPIYNIVLFNYEKAEAIKSNIVSIANTHLEIQQTDADVTKLDVRSEIEKLLGDISGLI